MGSRSATSQSKGPRPAPGPDPSSQQPFAGRLNPTAAARPARGLGGPQPRARSARSPPPAPASRRRVPPAPAPASCGAAHPGRAGLASERPRSARRAEQDEQGRKGRAPHRLGPPPPGEEGASRARSTTARASHTRRSAHPPRLSPRQARRSCPRTPRRTPSRLSAACQPARSRPSPSCGGSAPPLQPARVLPACRPMAALPCYISARGRGLGRELRGPRPPFCFPPALSVPPRRSCCPCSV